MLTVAALGGPSRNFNLIMVSFQLSECQSVLIRLRTSSEPMKR